MADVTILARLINGAQRNVDLTSSSLVTGSIKVGGLTNTELTKAILDRLVSLQDGSDVGSGYHTHNTLYYTKAQVGSTADGSSGASLVGIDQVPAFSHFTPTAATVQGALEGIDSALAVATAGSGTVKIDVSDTTAAYLTAKIVSGSSKLSKTILNSGANEQISLDVVESALSLNNISGVLSVAKGGTNSSTALSNNRVMQSSAGSIIEAAAITPARALISDANGIPTQSAVTSTELGYVSGVTSSIQTQLGTKALDSAVIKKDGSVDFTADQSMGSHKLTNLAAGSLSNDAVTFAQLQAVSNGNIWQAPLQDPDLIADNLSAPPGSPVDNTVYLIGPSPTGAWASLAGHVMYYSASAWHDILGRAVIVGDRFGVTLEHGSGSESGNMSGKHGDLITVTNATPGSYAYSVHTPVTYDSVLVNNSLSQHFSHSYSYNGSAWVEVAGPGVITAGTALAFSGNTLNVVYDNSTIDIVANALEVKAGGISNTQVSNTAAIAYSKLALTSSIVNADVSATAAIAYSKLALTNSIVASDLTDASVTAAKLATVTDGVTLDQSGAGATLEVKAGGISNAQVSNTAAIAYSKLALTSSIVNADINSAAAIAYSKLALTNSIVAGDLTANSVTAVKLASDVTLTAVYQRGQTITTESTHGDVIVAGTQALLVSAAGGIKGSTAVNGNLHLSSTSFAANNSSGQKGAVIIGDGSSLIVDSDSTNSALPLLAGLSGAGGAWGLVSVNTTGSAVAGNHLMLGSNGRAPYVTSLNAQGTFVAPTVMQAGQPVYTHAFQAYHDQTAAADYGSGQGNIAKMFVQVGATDLSSTNYGGQIVFHTGQAATTNVVTRLTMDEHGAIILGQAASGVAANLVWALDGQGTIGTSGALRPDGIFLKSSINVAAGKFAVDANGDITAIKNVTYSFPASQGAADSVISNDGSGNLSWVQQGAKTLTVGENMAANVSWLVRFAKSGETAGQIYKADYDTTSADKFYAIGIALKPTSDALTGSSIKVVYEGTHTLGSADSAFSSGDIGKPVYLTAAGAFSVTPPSASLQAVYKIGIVESTTQIWVGGIQLMGVN